MRLRYAGSASTWGFAIYRASHDDYEKSVLPSGWPAGTPQEALAAAASSGRVALCRLKERTVPMREPAQENCHTSDVNASVVRPRTGDNSNQPKI